MLSVLCCLYCLDVVFPVYSIRKDAEKPELGCWYPQTERELASHSKCLVLQHFDTGCALLQGLGFLILSEVCVCVSFSPVQ